MVNSFIHERSSAVIHLAIVHLENGQRFYFTAPNVQQIALNPPVTTLTALFKLCQNDAFPKILLYSEVTTYCTWNASRKSFERRKRGERVDGQPGTLKKNYKTVPIRRMFFLSSHAVGKCARSNVFPAIENINGVTHATFHAVHVKL
jgi:hypothetical protein